MAGIKVDPVGSFSQNTVFVTEGQMDSHCLRQMARDGFMRTKEDQL